MPTEQTPEEKVAELQAALEAEKAARADAEKTVEELSAKLDAAPKASTVNPVVTIDKKDYEILSGCEVPGLGTFTKDKLAKNKTAVKAVLEIEGQKIVKPLK